MSGRGKWFGVAAILAAAAVIVGVIVWPTSDDPEPPPAAAPHQVHLGDSFAAGAGTSPLVEDSPFTCQRSSANFGQLVAHDNGYRLTDVSCAGAWTKSFYESQYEGVGPQLDAVTADTDLVTLMIGGNDAALYSTLVGDCARVAESDPRGAPCRAELGPDPQRAVDDEIGPAVTKALRDIAARAPHAKIVIVGYPWLVPRSSACRPAVRIADGDIAYVRRVQTGLNAAIADAAAAAGAEFVDLSGVSDGHDACAAESVRWIEPMVGGRSPITMHPNEAGQRAMADAVEKALMR